MDLLQLNSTIDASKEYEHNSAPTLTWVNVAIGFVFILINGLISLLLGLKLEKSLIISAVRCMIQLTIMGFVLEDIFSAKKPALVFLMSCVLIVLGAYETVYNKSKQTYHGMFPAVLISSAVSTLIMGTIGVRFAIHQVPFWLPEVFIPILGMLLGNAMSGVAIAISYCLSTAVTRKEQIETYLAFGASRWEAGKTIAIEAVRLAMLPTINQMSVIGLISIPGMMTGQILGGASVENAVKYQQIIMFLISATSALSVLSAVVDCLRIVIDSHHRLRPERIMNGKASVFQDMKNLIVAFWRYIIYLFTCCRSKPVSSEREEEDDEIRSLLHGNKNKDINYYSRNESSSSIDNDTKKFNEKSKK